MNSRLVFKRASFKDLNLIASLHQQCFPNTFITSLGHTLIKEYYKIYIEKNDPFYVAFNGNDMVGFCLGYYNATDDRNIYIQNNKTRLFFRILLLCICFNKDAFLRVKLYLKTQIRKRGIINETRSADSCPEKDMSPDLLSICVKINYRGSGVSKSLIDLFESELIKNNAQSYTLSVVKDNIRAVGFYKKCGLTIEKENIHEYIMRKVLK